MPENEEYEVSNKRMTGLVVIDEKGTIVDVAPVFHRFKGQPFGNIVRWLSKMGETHVYKLRKW